MCDVPLIIEAQALEEQDVLAQIAIFGSPDPPMVSLIIFVCCVSERIRFSDNFWALRNRSNSNYV